MTERNAAKTAFLERAGWGAATRAHLAGDASNRTYERLALGAKRAVLMDAPPLSGEDIRPFMRIACHLGAIGLSAPVILAENAQAGLLLLEDLGDAIFARVARDDPAMEVSIYEAAVHALTVLHAHAPPAGLAHYGPAEMAGLAAMVFEWYAPGAPPAGERALRGAVIDAVGALASVAPVLVLRDYHAENLIWLPHRSGPARVGLLDFQDATTGHPVYDLVSLLEDARRDIGPVARTTAEARFCAATGMSGADLSHAMAALGAQRNLRILGIFARLAVRDAKTRYLDLMGRVWGHLLRDLSHPSLAALRVIVEDHVPAPDPAMLKALKDRCQKNSPTPS